MIRVQDREPAARQLPAKQAEPAAAIKPRSVRGKREAARVRGRRIELAGRCVVFEKKNPAVVAAGGDTPALRMRGQRGERSLVQVHCDSGIKPRQTPGAGIPLRDPGAASIPHLDQSVRTGGNKPPPGEGDALNVAVVGVEAQHRRRVAGPPQRHAAVPAAGSEQLRGGIEVQRLGAGMHALVLEHGQLPAGIQRPAGGDAEQRERGHQRKRSAQTFRRHSIAERWRAVTDLRIERAGFQTLPANPWPRPPRAGRGAP